MAVEKDNDHLKTVNPYWSRLVSAFSCADRNILYIVKVYRPPSERVRMQAFHIASTNGGSLVATACHWEERRLQASKEELCPFAHRLGSCDSY